jgi:hypothetical protein
MNPHLLNPNRKTHHQNQSKRVGEDERSEV